MPPISENIGLVIVPSKVKLSFESIKATLIAAERTLHCTIPVKTYPEDGKINIYSILKIML